MEKNKTIFTRIRDWIHGIFRVYCLEFSLIIHDIGMILFFTFLPLAYPIVYSLIYNPELVKEVPMVIVDHDRSSMSRELVRKMDACDEAYIIGYATDLNEARKAMASGDCYGILEIPEGFQKKIGRGETSPAVMYCDATLLLRYKGFLIASTNVMLDMGGELMTQTIDNVAPLAETIAQGDILPIENINLGNIRAGFDSFIMPGVLILILQQCLILAVGMAGGAKRETTRLLYYDKDLVSSSVFGSMLGQFLCYFTIIALPAVYMIHYVPMMFSFPVAGNLFEETMMLVPLIMASVGVGFTLQAMVTERESVFVMWVVTSIFFLFVSGLIWPLYDMPKVWRWLGAISPSTWGVEAFIKMNSNGSSLADVRQPYINLWILAAFWWLMGWCAQKWNVRPAIKRWMSLRKSVVQSGNQIWPNDQ